MAAWPNAGYGVTQPNAVPRPSGAWTYTGSSRARPQPRPCSSSVARPWPVPPLARQRRARAFAAGVPAAWVTGDGVYGHDRRLRLWLEARPHASVLAVSGQAYVWGRGQPRQVKTILATLPGARWTRLSADDGAPGPRWYDWRWRPLAKPAEPGWRRWLLVRRRVSTPPELQAYVVFAPPATTLEAAVRVAGHRWTGWSRPITLVRWALALRTVMRAGTLAVEALKKSLRPPPEASPLAAFKAWRGLASR